MNPKGQSLKDPFSDTINSRLWQEQAAPGNPFAADVCRASGYDVYGDLLGKASYVEYLYLLFKRERPAPQLARAFQILAIALANPGPRDPSVHAAMATGASGTPAAASLIAALACGAGSYGGGREVFLAMQAFEQRGTDLAAWTEELADPPVPTRTQVWPEPQQPAGFETHSSASARPTRQTLALLAATLPDGRCAWLQQQRAALEAAAGHGLAMTAVSAAALLDLGFGPDEGEMLSLLLRLPGAAAHALEQKQQGFRQFPFFHLDLQDDPQGAQP